MGKQFMGLVSAMAMGLTLVSGVADAKPSHHRKDDRARYEWRGNQRNWEPSRSYRSGNYRERRLGRNDQIFRGHDGRAYARQSVWRAFGVKANCGSVDPPGDFQVAAGDVRDSQAYA